MKSHNSMSRYTKWSKSLKLAGLASALADRSCLVAKGLRTGPPNARFTWAYNALFGNRPTAADADWPDAYRVRDMKVTGCSHQPETEETCV